MLFAQLVDDPSAWPDEFQTEEEQAKERERLHKIIKDMVPWKATNDEDILGKARFEIARSIARGRGDAPPQRDKPKEVLEYLAKNAPPVCDPFCGGGSIPLEAQRLGLRAHGSDLNPVAVLVSKATCEIPPKFAGRAPVNPERDRIMSWKGAQGLAVRSRRMTTMGSSFFFGSLSMRPTLMSGTSSLNLHWQGTHSGPILAK